LATLITPAGQQFSVAPQDSSLGFTKAEMDRLIAGECKAFSLQNGQLLLLDSLACLAPADQRNDMATRLLRGALDDPGGQVCGHALLLGKEESNYLSAAQQTALHLDDNRPLGPLLLLDRNEGVRPVLALGLERRNFSVIQAQTATEALGFCQSHKIEILVADVSSLRPEPLQTLGYIREAQPQVKVMLISGYDVGTVAKLYPGLLTGVEFLQKPFTLHVMANTAHWVAGAQATSEQRGDLAAVTTDSS